MPLELFKHRTLATANGVAALLAAAMFSWFFLSALYLQLVLGYSPLDVGLAFLPATILMGAFSLGLSARVVMRFGIRDAARRRARRCSPPACSGSRARRSTGRTSTDVLPSMILLALGAGLAFNPLLLAAMGDVAPEQSGLASGLVNTTQMMGGAARPRDPRRASPPSRTADPNDLGDLTAGYHAAFLVGRRASRSSASSWRRLLMEAKMPAHGRARTASAPEAVGDARPIGRPSATERHELPEERARRRRVEPVVDVRRAAWRVAGDRRRGEDVRLGRPAPRKFGPPESP